MQWSDVWPITLCSLIVGLVLKSMFRHWHTASEPSRLEGWYKSAENWLEANHYQIIRRKQSAKWSGYLDATEYEVPLKADFIVRKDGKSYAVEVGTWDANQFTEDQLRTGWYPVCSAFDVQGILFVDVDHEAVHTADFELKPASYVMWKRMLSRGLWLISGVVMTFAWLHGR